MKKISVFTGIYFFSFLTVFSQPTQAEIDKMMREAKAEIEKMKKDPKNKDFIKDIPNLDSKVKNTSKNDNQELSKSSTGKFPAKNTALLSAIPKKIFTRAELIVYYNDLYKQFALKINAVKVKAVSDIMAKPGGNAYKFNVAAVGSWYNGATEEAILMATKAAMQYPDDDVLVNNLSAMLNMGGLEQKAIPVLRTLLQKYPDNPMVLNNMGQAYAALGATDTAMIYLGRCIAKSPHHPEANNTAGQIELSKGNKQKATGHFEQSLKGAYNNHAYNGLRIIDPKKKYGKLLRPPMHIPEYFNPAKYKLPRQCENLQQAAAAKEEHNAFEKMLATLIKKYDAIQKAETEIAEQTILKKYSTGINQAGNLPPFLELGTLMLIETSLDYLDEVTALASYNQNFTLELKKLESEYEQAQKVARAKFDERNEKVGEGNGDPSLDEDICKAYEDVANKYLQLFSTLRLNWQVKNLAAEKKYLNELIYWSYLASHNIHDFRKSFYSLITAHLTKLKILTETKIIYPCDREEADKQKYEEPLLTEPECPFEVEVKFIVGKFSLDCEKVSFSGGEGFIFTYEKKFKSGQSTLSLGIGAQLELGGGFGGVKIGAGISAGESLFIQLGSNGQVTDAGLKFGVKAGAGIEAEGAIGKNVNIKKDFGKVEEGVGYTIGIESGIKFNEGPLKNLLTPSENQLNKNVPVFKKGD